MKKSNKHTKMHNKVKHLFNKNKMDRTTYTDERYTHIHTLTHKHEHMG